MLHDLEMNKIDIEIIFIISFIKIEKFFEFSTVDVGIL